MENFSDFLISTAPDEITCNEHKSKLGPKASNCQVYQNLKEKVQKYQSHEHTFTCAKKSRTITIKENEGHGRFDGKIKRTTIIKHFNFSREYLVLKW